MDLCDVVFAHAVNDLDALADALADPEVNVLEADVLWLPTNEHSTGAATSDEEEPADRVVMGHDLAAYTNVPADKRLTLRRWLQLVLKSPVQVGVKIDIKHHAAVPDTLKALQEYEGAYAEAHQNDDEDDARDHAHEHAGVGDVSVAQASEPPASLTKGLPRGRARMRGRPMLKLYRRGAYFLRPAVLVNADVLPSSAPCMFNASNAALPRAEQVVVARSFVADVCTALPSALLSLGWRTCAHGQCTCIYTPQDVTDMLQVTREYAEAGVAFTFAVRGSYVLRSGTALAPLLASYPLNSLTIWSHEEISARAFAPLRAKLLQPTRTMMDLPPDAKERRARAQVARRRTYLFSAFLFAAAACVLPTLRSADFSDEQRHAVTLAHDVMLTAVTWTFSALLRVAQPHAVATPASTS